VSGFSRTSVVSGFSRTSVVSGFSRTSVVSGFSRTNALQASDDRLKADATSLPPNTSFGS
jgi:hypothetical protein